MLLARVLAGHDLHGLWERQFRPDRGPPGLAPGEFWDLTAAQLLRLHFRFLAPEAERPAIDAVACVAAANRAQAARGELPVIPFHILPTVPRG